MTAKQIFDFVANANDEIKRSFVFLNDVELILPPKDDGTEKTAALRALCKLPIAERRELIIRLDREARPSQLYTTEPCRDWADGWWYDR